MGVWQTPPGDTERAVGAALAAGYRHVDTAAAYGNEAEVGRALAGAAAAGIDRDDVFVVTKLWNADQGYDETLQAFDTSLDKLGLGHLDLYLVHWPMPERGTTSIRSRPSRTCATRAEFARSVSATSNRSTCTSWSTRPASCPPSTRSSCIPFCPSRNCGICTRNSASPPRRGAPLGQGSLLEHATVVSVAGAHAKTPAQVLIRWHVQLGNIVIPKSVHPERIASNFDVFDFELSEQDMASIASLSDGTRPGTRSTHVQLHRVGTT